MLAVGLGCYIKSAVYQICCIANCYIKLLLFMLMIKSCSAYFASDFKNISVFIFIDLILSDIDPTVILSY